MNRMLIGLLSLLITGAIASAQPSQRDDRVRHDPYITSTGATVDKPGVPQASGPTPLDRGIQRQDNQIDKGICKGC